MDIPRLDLKKRSKRKKLVILVGSAVAVLIGAIFVGAFRAGVSRVDGSKIWTGDVARGNLMREVSAPGQLLPKESRWIASETPAKVEKILVKPGVLVSADTVIMQLSNAELVVARLAADVALKASQAEYAAKEMTLRSQLLDQKANLAGVRAEYEGLRLQAEAEAELAGTGIISKLQARRTQFGSEQLKLRVQIESERLSALQKMMEAQLRAERARLSQFVHDATERERQVQALSVKAGLHGVLQQVSVEEGQQLVAGASIARVAKPNTLFAQLRVSEVQAKDIAFGQRVRIDMRDGIVTGLVARIDPAVKSGAVLVDVDLPGKLPASARPDLSVDGVVEIERLENVLFVAQPMSASQDAQAFVFRVSSDKSLANRVPVRFGRASATAIQVLSGLKEGDQVILSDTTPWQAYESVRIN